MATILTTTPASTIEIDARLLREWPLPEPGWAAGGEERGSLLVLAGSREMPGAASLSAIAALRAGAGRLAVATVASMAEGFALSHPEARIVALPETEGGGFAADGLARLEPLLGQVDTVLVGPGLMDASATRAFVRRLVKRTPRAAIVLDALAMELIVDLRRFERPLLMTPHADELSSLIGVTLELILADPERYAREASIRWNAVVALIGPSTFVATPDGGCWCHASTHVGLATSGSGDVLAGLIAGLSTRGAPLAQAAAWGVALHSRAGRALAERVGPIGYLASELAAEVPRLMQRLAH